jgi:hypothetical protein
MAFARDSHPSTDTTQTVAVSARRAALNGPALTGNARAFARRRLR